MGEDIRLKSKAGEIGAYLAAPKGTPKGGVVVIQEIFGVNHHIRAVTDKFAANGYLALAPRFFDHIIDDTDNVAFIKVMHEAELAIRRNLAGWHPFVECPIRRTEGRSRSGVPETSAESPLAPEGLLAEIT